MVGKKRGMGVQRIFMMILLVAVVILGYYYAKPTGKYHKTTCFWVKVYSEKDPEDFQSGTLFVGIYSNPTSAGSKVMPYLASERLSLQTSGLKRCIWCRPSKP